MIEQKKPGRPPGSRKVTFSPDRLTDALLCKNTTIAEIARTSKNGEHPVGEKTIRKWKREKAISEKGLYALSQLLDVTPDYLMGKYDSAKELMTPILDRSGKKHLYLSPLMFPYSDHEQRISDLDHYISTLMEMHGLSKKQYDDLDELKRLDCGIDITNAVASVLYRYFPVRTNGYDSKEAVYQPYFILDSWRDAILNPDPDIPDDYTWDDDAEQISKLEEKYSKIISLPHNSQ